MKNMKLRTRLLIGGLTTLVIPLAIIGIVSVYQSSKSISDIQNEHLQNISMSLVHALEIGMNEQLLTARNISYSNSVIAASEKVAHHGEKSSRNEILLAQKELTKIKDGEGDRFSSITLVPKNGVVYASSDSGKMNGLNLAGRDYLDLAFKGTANVGSTVVSRATGRVICTAACPIYASKGKEITGAVVMAVELKYLTDIIDKMKIGKTGYPYLLDKNGFFVTHPVKEDILKVNVRQIKGMESVVSLMSERKPGLTETAKDGIKRVAAVHPVEIAGWTVVSSIPKEELLLPARFTRNVIITLSLIFLILASTFFYFFARGIARPMAVVVGAAQQIALGDLTATIPKTEGRDEMAVLSRAFTRMIESLRERARAAESIAARDLTVKITALSEKDAFGNSLATMAEQLRKQIQDIVEGVNVLASSGSEIMASVTQLTSGAAETSTAVSETTTTVEQAKQTAELSSRKAKHVAELGQKASEISKAGLKSIDDAVEGMNRIREQVESIADMVVRLSEQSQAIGEIVATVNDLAEQSGLLAVNASIEAAKAGEQGRGFAVVAQEIRSLADQSKQATTQIRTILFDVQKAITSAVMATEQGGKAVEAGVKLSAQAGEVIETLAGSVEEATNAAMQIAVSSQQQLVGMDQVVSAMENIRDASVQTAASAKQTEKAAHDLHNLGQRLQEMVGQYKV
jgi:methyl-accepting chemotaxis protein